MSDEHLVAAATELLLMRDTGLDPILKANGEIELEAELAEARTAARDYLVAAFREGMPRDLRAVK